jgi:alpha-N-arabinofuranosidase
VLANHPTAAELLEGISVHHYTLPTSNWSAKGAPIGFPEEQWFSTMARALQMDTILDTNTAILDRADPNKRIGLYVDEWGTWYDTTEGHNPGFLYQQNTLRDAIVAGVNFHIFHEHAERVRMANIAQMVNVLQAMVLTDGPRMLRTPTYHAFEMYRPFQGATSFPVEVTASAYAHGEASVVSVSASAARTTDGKIVLALVNLDPNVDAAVSAQLAGVTAQRVSGRILTADTMDAHNTFEAPDQVVPVAFEGASLQGGALALTLPAKSVLVLILE